MRIRTLISLSLAGVLTAVTGAAPFATETAQKQPKVMVLGTFHFDSPGLDLINIDTDDVLGERRQAEIEDAVERLARFQPTKVAVELLPEHEDRFNDAYRAYRNGRRQLGMNEREQLGMRLAAKLGHERMYAVDYMPQSMDFSSVMEAGRRYGQDEILSRLQDDFSGIEETLTREQSPDRSIVEMLAFHNGPWAEDGNRSYLRMAVLGAEGDAVGADVVSQWYSRNLHIYAKIARLAEDPGERILVVYGSGHRDHLTDFFEESPDFKLVSPLDYLTGLEGADLNDGQ